MEIKNLNIAWFTEGNWVGKIPQNHVDMRNDSAWMNILDATHYCIFDPPNIEFDLSIITLPKKNITHIIQNNSMAKIKKNSKKVIMMQEGPHWFFQDFTMFEQIWYYNTLMEFDMIWAHNKKDVNYYFGLTGIKTIINPTLMIMKDQQFNYNKENKVIIGGNFCNWYGGFNSFIIARLFNCPIYVPSMGRKIPQEEEMDITHLPYMKWMDWMNTLSTFSYGVHLMPTHAAGTFTLNCAALEIPCIGYSGLDTQKICHPKLTVDDGDIVTASKLAKKLRDNKKFWKECSLEAKENFNNSLFNKRNYIPYITDVINNLF